MPISPVITGAQIRAARAMLRWTVCDLAEMASVSVATVDRAEAIDGVPRAAPLALLRIRQSMERAGIVFLSEAGLGWRQSLSDASGRTHLEESIAEKPGSIP